MKITIITVCYNANEVIVPTLESVVNQTYPEIEYLLIDGGSTDGTLSVLENYSNRNNVYVFSEKDFGIYNAMNRGIARANGDYIYFLNAGDVLSDDFVIENVARYIGDEKNVIFYGHVKIVSPGALDQIKDYDGIPGEFMEKLFQGNMPCHQGIFAPKNTLRNHYFREELRLRADYEWLMYSVQKGVRCKSIPFVIAHYNNIGQSGTMKNATRMQKETEIVVWEYQNREQCQTHTEYTEQPVISQSEWEFLANKHWRMFVLLNRWMIIKQKGMSITNYCKDRNIESIAIYGIGYLGERLLEELRDTEIKVKYLIDQNATNKCSELKIYGPDNELPAADAVIVTALVYFDEIEEKIKNKNNFLIISLEEIIMSCLEKCL